MSDPKTGIAVRRLTFEVPDKRILDNVDLEIAQGEIVSIMGQSGSGKTTLLKLMTGLNRATSGEIWIDGTNIAPMSETELDTVRLKMGLVFQYAALFDSLTVYENIVFSVVRHKRLKRSELDAMVRELLSQVGLEGIEQKYPSQLSGGMRKRVGLARALAMEPPFLFYDEPTSGLDPITARATDDLILETGRNRNVTSVVVSHHLPSIFRISDKVAMLDKGKIAVFGTPEEVRNSTHPVVEEFLGPDRAAIGR